MRPATSVVWSLIAISIRGLRSRLLLTAGSVLLAAISVGAAVVGPMYQSGAASSYLVTKLRSEPGFLTGVVLDYSPPETGSRDTGPGHFEPGGYATALAEARKLADQQLNDQFTPATAALWTGRIPSSLFDGEAAVLAAPGACMHLAVTGRCPSAPGEVLVLRYDSNFAGVRVGARFHLPYVRIPLHVVGVYAPRAKDENFWFDLADLKSVPAQPYASLPLPYRPAPLITAPETFDRITLPPAFVKASRRLIVTPSTSVADLQSAVRAVKTLKAAQAAGDLRVSGLTPETGNQLVSIASQVELRRSTARSTVAPAVVSVVLVALVLLARLFAAAMELRRTELALASLRGYSRRQMWLLGLVEPVLTVLLATPLGLVGGYLCYRALARTWLVPGLPVPLGGGIVLALLTVLVATMTVAALVVRESLGETLSQQIAGVRRPGRSGRWALLLRFVVVAAAGTVLVATLAASKRSAPDATDLALPILLAVAAGLLTALGAQVLARGWAAWTAGRRGVFSFLASRTISRRREGTLVILPLTAALAVSIFAAGVFKSAADWRASDAATLVGADLSYPTELTMGQAVALTHRIDPAGSWLMASGAWYDGKNQIQVLDAPRLARVGLWPASWTPGLTAADVSRELSVQRPSVTLSGARLTMTVDNRLSGDFARLGIELTMTDDNGDPASVVLGPMKQGVSTVTARLAGCASACQLLQMSFGGPAGLTGAMNGSATITSMLMDARPVPGFLDQPWRVADPLLTTPSGVAGQPDVSDRRLTVRFGARSADSFAAVTPTDVPLVRPVVLGRMAPLGEGGSGEDTLRLPASDYRTIALRPALRTESMPVLGPVGILIDYTMLTRDVTISGPSTDVSILARSDAPESVVAALADHGISQAVQVSTTRAVLDSDAFALALNLYLVVTVIVILLALAGLGASLAVQMPSRRRDAASLRVVGLRRRSILAAVIAEFVVVLGAAALAGVGAGSLAQYVVVRTVTLGYADTQHTPRLLASLDLVSLLELLLVVTVALFVVSATVAGLTVRGARTASLRENAR
ncbi:MAG: FtsX-like permease family protein [Nocardioidaceae bacterium]